MFFLSTYFVPFLIFFLKRGLRVGVKLRLLKLIDGGSCEGEEGGSEKIENLISAPLPSPPPSIKHPKVMI